MSAANSSKPLVIIISLDYAACFEDLNTPLFDRILKKAQVQRTRKAASALRILEQQDPRPPSAVLITDSALTEEHPEVWDAIVAYVRRGGTAIAMAQFSGFVKMDNFKPFFARAGLEWDRGDYHRTDVRLNRQHAAASSSSVKLPDSYSQKALFAKGVHPSAVLYGPHDESYIQSHVFPPDQIQDLTQAAVAFAKVGEGWVGYAGDVNAEKGTDDVVLAMCGLL